MNRLTAVSVAMLIAAWAWGQDITHGRTLLADDFTRFAEGSADLGQLPGAEASWGKRVPIIDGEPMDNAIRAGGGALTVGYASGQAPFDTGVWIEGFTIADGAISLTVGPSHMADRCNNASISYRTPTGEAAAGSRQKGAYHVDLAGDWSGSRDVWLRYGTDLLATGNVGNARAPTAPHQVKVAFSGDRHSVCVDGVKVIDYWEIDAGRTSAGFVGFGGWYSIGAFDDFVLAEAVAGLERRPSAPGADGPLFFQGRPFFPIGTYNPPDEDDLEEWVAAGCNTTVLGVPGEAATPEQRATGIRASADWAAKREVAVIWFPGVDFYSQADGKPTVTKPEDIPPKVALLEEMLAITAGDAQTFGYCTFDEPENVLYPTYKDWDQKKDQGLAEWIAQGMGWTFSTLKQADPDAYVMPIVAWWTTYKDLAPLYDVNFPNHYPTLKEHPPLQGNLYEVVLDAALAADAARETDRIGFVYMPGIFDLMPGRWRAATLRELRYTCFAPITQGALGVVPWRLGYCSMPYRRAVVYPVMRELSRLRPWLLGEWCDGLVTSNRDEATVEYLRKLPKRVRLVEAEEKVETVESDVVPDCSHCLRRRPDNTYLLLAVNNRREPLEVTFTLSGIDGLPDHALDYMEYASVRIVDGRLSDTLEPFAVRAYVIEVK